VLAFTAISVLRYYVSSGQEASAAE